MNVEKLFFDSFSPMLSDGQQPLLKMVQGLRSRNPAATAPPLVPGGDFDMIREIYRLHANGFDIAPNDAVSFMSLLSDYDSKCTALFDSHFAALLRLWSDGAVLSAHRFDPNAQADPTITPKVEAMRTDLVEMELRRHDLAASTVIRITPLLVDETSAELVRRFRQRTYAAVYPDPTDVSEVVDAMIAASFDDLERQSQIRAVAQQFDAQRQAKCDAMTTAYLNFKRENSIKWPMPPEDRALYDLQMKRLNDDRIQIADACLTTITAILSAEQLAACQPSIDAYHERRTAVELLTDPHQIRSLRPLAQGIKAGKATAPEVTDR